MSNTDSLTLQDIELLEIKRDYFLLKHSENNAYTRWIDYLENHEKFKSIKSETIDEIFSKPSSYNIDAQTEEDENGDTLGENDYSPPLNSGILSIDNFGWLTDVKLKKQLLQDPIYKNLVRPKIGDMPEEVKGEIEQHALHILGRSSNPTDWDRNKQGLVYGMVQSGKTANMITLMGLAKSAGYSFFIILAGDKTSLRDQTQDRINNAFKLSDQGYNHTDNIRSLTTKNQDYSELANQFDNGVQLWDLRSNQDGKTTYIACVKKNKDVLKKLIQHLEEIKSEINSNSPFVRNLDFENNFKTLIIDDEADYASLNILPNRSEGSAIFSLLTELRTILPKNCYIAYTATPQGCLGADPEALIGYPKDFIWYIAPHHEKVGDKNQTSTYLGLEEFFVHYPLLLIDNLSDTAWPYWKKDDGGTPDGIYKPSGEINKERLIEAETQWINQFIEEYTIGNKNNTKDYYFSLIDYLISCGIRWYRYNLEEKKELSQEYIESDSDWPYHAIMFNLSNFTKTHKRIIDLIELIWEDVKADWEKCKTSYFENSSVFINRYEKQLNKSNQCDKQIPAINDLESYIDIAIKITNKQIIDSDRFIYLLNSKDEGITLKYSHANIEEKPKKAVIIVGGSILSRGLTIENLTISVFGRSQAQSVGDTNLQMCRWFGHKRKYIDLISVFMQNHALSLFEQITEADFKIRKQISDSIENGKEENMIVYLYSSPFFKATSDTKAKNLTKS